MNTLPRFVSVVAVLLGCFDLIRGLVHTVLFGSVGAPTAGLDLAGPTGRDQLMLMAAFGSANFITGAALIYLGLANRFGALVLMAVIPVAMFITGVSIAYWEVDLVGQGVFPGTGNMTIYVLICTATVVAGLALAKRPSNVRPSAWHPDP